MLALTLGSIVLSRQCNAVCQIGESGVCYEQYTIGNRPGWSIIFRDGGYDGFSPDEVNRFLYITGEISNSVSRYQFQNVRKLIRDYNCGLFTMAFKRELELQ